jgi:hypothetical protein
VVGVQARPGPQATLVIVGAPKGTRLLGPLSHVVTVRLAAMRSTRKVVFFVAKFNRPDLDVLRELLEAGKVTPVVERQASRRAADRGEAGRPPAPARGASGSASSTSARARATSPASKWRSAAASIRRCRSAAPEARVSRNACSASSAAAAGAPRTRAARAGLSAQQPPRRPPLPPRAGGAGLAPLPREPAPRRGGAARRARRSSPSGGRPRRRVAAVSRLCQGHAVEVAFVAASAGGVVGAVAVPAGPDDAQPGAGEDADGVGVAAAAGAGVAVDAFSPGRRRGGSCRRRG